MEQEQLALFDLAGDRHPGAAGGERIELTTMQQVSRHKRAGNPLFCACPGSPRAEIRDVRYSQSSFQVKVVDVTDWITPIKIWAETPEAADRAYLIAPPAPSVNPCVMRWGVDPQGRLCKACSHMIAKRADKVYWKCDLRKITAGPGSDHRRNWPACARFEPLDSGPGKEA